MSLAASKRQWRVDLRHLCLNIKHTVGAQDLPQAPHGGEDILKMIQHPEKKNHIVGSIKGVGQKVGDDNLGRHIPPFRDKGDVCRKGWTVRGVDRRDICSPRQQRRDR